MSAPDESARDWLELVAERDYLDWWLRQSHAKLKKRTPLEAAIDRATKSDQQQLKEVEAAIARIHELTAMLDGEQQ